MQVVKAFECSAQGPRKEMQDVTLKKRGRDGTYFFGIFDGHRINGGEIAQAARDRVVQAIDKRAVAFNSVREYGWFMRSTFRSIDRTLDGRAVNSGTTATVATFKNDEIATVWLGDSEAAFYPDHGKSFKFVKPHNVYNQLEVARALSLGYSISRNKFGGSLAVSRAIGDHREGFISAEASISPVYRLPGPGTLVVASDAHWGSKGQYHLKMEEYVRMLKDPLELDEVAEDIVDLFAELSMDNASMVAAYIA